MAAKVTLRVLGSGDPFGSGGRNPSAYLVEGEGRRILLDCGAASGISLKKHGVDTASVDLVLLTHFHADHVAGLPLLFHDFRLATLRRSPLLVAGPRGVRRRVEALDRALFPSRRKRRFRVVYFPLTAGRPFRPPGLWGVRILPFRVRHQAAAVSFGYRVEISGRRLVYSGDTGWFDGLAREARGANLFLCECTHRSQSSPGHLSLRELAELRPRLDARRILLTHLGPGFAPRGRLRGFELARDGMLVRV